MDGLRTHYHYFSNEEGDGYEIYSCDFPDVKGYFRYQHCIGTNCHPRLQSEPAGIGSHNFDDPYLPG